MENILDRRRQAQWLLQTGKALLTFCLASDLFLCTASIRSDGGRR